MARHAVNQFADRQFAAACTALHNTHPPGASTRHGRTTLSRCASTCRRWGRTMYKGGRQTARSGGFSPTAAVPGRLSFLQFPHVLVLAAGLRCESISQAVGPWPSRADPPVRLNNRQVGSATARYFNEFSKPSNANRFNIFVFSIKILKIFYPTV
jgi:hypothetical protein